MSDSVTVAVRLRPLNDNELRSSSTVAWGCVHGDEVRQIAKSSYSGPNPRAFRFDAVFDTASTNAQVYETLAAPLVESAVQGTTATLFAYGQTSSGKTHTMLGSSADPGMTPRALQHLLEAAGKASPPLRVRATYVEIYNDRVHDLLDPTRRDLAIREDARGSVSLEASAPGIASLDDALTLLARGQAVRHVADTPMNQRSSRSHTVFSVLLDSDSNDTRASALHLVDLAGSERAGTADPMRMREAAHINRSLLALGTIVARLSSRSKSAGNDAHLPFRDSKLTRLLRPALSGSSHAAVLCAITPASAHSAETLTTLQFGARAKLLPVRKGSSKRLPRAETLDYRRKFHEASAEMAKLRAKFAELEKELDELRRSAAQPERRSEKHSAPPSFESSVISSNSDELQQLYGEEEVESLLPQYETFDCVAATEKVSKEWEVVINPFLVVNVPPVLNISPLNSREAKPFGVKSDDRKDHEDRGYVDDFGDSANQISHSMDSIGGIVSIRDAYKSKEDDIYGEDIVQDLTSGKTVDIEKENTGRNSTEEVLLEFADGPGVRLTDEVSKAKAASNCTIEGFYAYKRAQSTNGESATISSSNIASGGVDDESDVDADVKMLALNSRISPKLSKLEDMENSHPSNDDAVSHETLILEEENQTEKENKSCMVSYKIAHCPLQEDLVIDSKLIIGPTTKSQKHGVDNNNNKDKVLHAPITSMTDSLERAVETAFAEAADAREDAERARAALREARRNAANIDAENEVLRARLAAMAASWSQVRMRTLVCDAIERKARTKGRKIWRAINSAATAASAKPNDGSGRTNAARSGCSSEWSGSGSRAVNSDGLPRTERGSKIGSFADSPVTANSY